MRNWPPDCKTWRLLREGGGTPGMWKNLAFAWHHRWGTNAYVGGLQRVALTATGDAKNIYDESAGLIRQWPANALGWGAPQEPARTNLLTYSRDLTHADWTVATNVTIAADNVAGPDGVTSAERVTDNDTDGQHRIYRAHTFATNAAHTFSVFVKKGTLDYFGLLMFDGTDTFWASFNLLTYATGTTGAGTTAGISARGNGWYRCWITATCAAAAGNVQLVCKDAVTEASAVNSYIGSGQTIYWDMAQLEVGAYPTSFIPTTTATVSRAADAARLVDSNLFGRLSNAGTLLAVFDFPYLVAADTRVCALTNADDSTDNYAAILVNSSAAIRGETKNNAGSQTLLSSGVTQAAKTAFAAAVSWADSYQGAAANGVSASAAAGGGIVGLDRLELGGLLTTDTRPGVNLYAVLGFSRALSVDELRALTLNPGALKNAS